MDFDFRAKRLENEQKKLKEAAKKKLEKEQEAKRKQEQREKEMEEFRIKQEELKEQLKVEKEMIEAHELSLTNGISFQKSYNQFYIIPPQDLELGDKIILPEDCLVELTNLDVFQKQKAVNFQLEISYKITSIGKDNSIRKLMIYCGINEFTAPENTIGLPPKIIDTLKYHGEFGKDESENLYFNPFIPPFPVSSTALLSTSSTAVPFPPINSTNSNLIEGTELQIVSVSIKYMNLPKVTYLKFKPKFHNFYNIEAIKRCLEENLSYHTSITLHDLIVIKYRGEEYPLAVTDIKPERYGSLLNTDVEVDFEYSEEYETVKKDPVKPVVASSAPVETSQLAGSAVGQRLGGGRRIGDSAPATSEATPMDIAPTTEENHEMINLLFNHSLPEEPTATAAGPSLATKFKLPNGKSIMRKFALNNTLLDLFCFCVLEMKKQNNLPSSLNDLLKIQLSMTSPTHQIFSLPVSAVSQELSKSLIDLGFENMKNQLFFVQYAT